MCSTRSINIYMCSNSVLHNIGVAISKLLNVHNEMDGHVIWTNMWGTIECSPSIENSFPFRMTVEPHKTGSHSMSNAPACRDSCDRILHIDSGGAVRVDQQCGFIIFFFVRFSCSHRIYVLNTTNRNETGWICVCVWHDRISSKYFQCEMEQKRKRI